METNKENISIKSIIVKYLHHWKLFVVVFILSFIPAILYLKLMPRTYQFKASVLLQEEEKSSIAGMPMGEVAGLMKSFGISTGGGTISIEDEMGIMTSNRMLRQMINRLGINIIYSRPYSFYKMYNEAPLKLSVDSATMANLDEEYRFTVSVEPGNIKVKVKSIPDGYKNTFNFQSLPAVIKAGADEFTLDFDNDGSANQSFKLKIRCVPSSWMAEELNKNLVVEDISKASNILEISCSDHVKSRGKDMINTLIDEYNKDVVNYDREKGEKTIDFVDGRITVLLDELNETEKKIQDYKKKNNMTLLESDVTMYGELVKDLEVAIVEAESQSRMLDMIDEYIKKPENKYAVIPSLITATEGEKGGAIRLYNEALIQREKVLKNSNENNAQFKTYTYKVDKLREGVYAMIENSKKNYNQTLSGLKARENQIFSKMKSVPEQEREYMGYRRDQEIQQGIYLMMLQKKEEITMTLGDKIDRARLIEPAYVEKKPLGPRKLFALIGMIALTLIIPVVYIMSKELYASLKEEYKRSN
ncbi:MAG: tyrosine protein kinase [Tannerella sp.]|jgi:uncharacterized protein involved in exopolysaccharide biosynthesis|nr:tyrosine protein kinase [Tannerella sp.]